MFATLARLENKPAADELLHFGLLPLDLVELRAERARLASVRDTYPLSEGSCGGLLRELCGAVGEVATAARHCLT